VRPQFLRIVADIGHDAPFLLAAYALAGGYLAAVGKIRHHLGDVIIDRPPGLLDGIARYALGARKLPLPRQEHASPERARWL
jgi:hypothetical protein